MRVVESHFELVRAKKTGSRQTGSFPAIDPKVAALGGEESPFGVVRKKPVRIVALRCNIRDRILENSTAKSDACSPVR